MKFYYLWGIFSKSSVVAESFRFSAATGREMPKTGSSSFFQRKESLVFFSIPISRNREKTDMTKSISKRLIRLNSCGYMHETSGMDNFSLFTGILIIGNRRGIFANLGMNL